MSKKRTAKPEAPAKIPAPTRMLSGLRDGLRDDRWFLAAILAFAVCLPWLHLHFIQRMPAFGVPVMDSLDYVRTAEGMLDPGASPEPFYHSPLYAGCVAFVFRIFGHSLEAVLWLQIALHAATTLLMYALGRKLFGRNVGRMAGLICLYGPIVFFNTEILNVALILFLNVFGLLLVVEAWEAPGSLRWAAAGIVLGLAVLARADVLVFVLMLPGAILLGQRAFPFRTRLRHAGFAVAGTAILLLAIGLRNRSVDGRFAMLPGNGGMNFYQGNNPEYKTTIGIRIASWHKLAHMPLAEGVGTEMNELGHGPFYYAKAFRYIKERTGDWLGCVSYKIRVLANGYELPETFDVYTSARYSPILRALAWKLGPFYFPFGLMLPVAVWGAWIARKNRTAWWCLAYLGAMSVSLLVYWNSTRYRLGIVPVLLLWAALAAQWFWRQLREGNWLALASGTLVVILAGIPVLWPIDHFSKTFNFDAERSAMAGQALMETDPDRGLSLLRQAAAMDPKNCFVHYGLGVGLWNVNQLDEAIVEFTKAVAIDPQYYPAYDYRGKALGRKNQPAQAEKDFRRVLELYPRSYLTHYSLGIALMQQGRVEEAVEHYRIATDINPALADAYNNWGSLLMGQNRLDEALPLFEQVLRINPSHQQAQANLQIIMEQRSRNQRR
ncbi:MAG: tetratricopeptide repeat protein [Opitutaceae bacterium]|jgi:tetratricopeptide (TPR) repeat protein